VPPASEPVQPPDSSRAPRAGLILMGVIVAGTALIAIYANVQKARRDKIEKVTIIPVSSTPIPSTSPAVP
jgi:hypothetical protein